MKHINEYINEELQQINEFLLTALCAAVATHFTVKGLKKIRKYSNNFWDWATGEKDINMSMGQASESLNEAKKQKFDKNNVMPQQIESEDILQKVIDKTGPKVTNKSKKGFYVFQQLLKDDSNFKKINKAPYFPNYVVFMDPGSEDNREQKPNFYGMLGFSIKYWKVVSKKGKDEKVKEAASKLTDYLHIFAVQTDPKYAKAGLFDVYLESMKKALKELKMTGITIKYEDEELIPVFEKYGFKKIDGLDGYMILGEKKEEQEQV